MRQKKGGVRGWGIRKRATGAGEGVGGKRKGGRGRDECEGGVVVK